MDNTTGTEHEITMDKIVQMINQSKGEFIIHVSFGEECASDGSTEPVQT